MITLPRRGNPERDYLMTEPSTFGLDAYLERLGYRGPRTPTLGVLSELQRRHVCTIPFENLDIHLGRAIRLDLPSIERKLVHDRRGGYCFEQNALFQAALLALGFKVTPLIGRVRWQVPDEVPTAQTHMILMVELEDRRYLVDGGFGSASLSAPLLMDTEAEQPTPHEPRRLLQRRGMYVHQTKVGDEWADVYTFLVQPVPAIDYEVANWFTSTWPQSRFTQNLIAAFLRDDCRHTLVNREFTTRWLDGRREKRELSSPGELLEVLEQYFTLSFPADTRFGRPGAPWPV
jgi:N-hydroxyarylamine O-acetyltransferase